MIRLTPRVRAHGTRVTQYAKARDAPAATVYGAARRSASSAALLRRWGFASVSSSGKRRDPLGDQRRGH